MPSRRPPRQRLTSSATDTTSTLDFRAEQRFGLAAGELGLILEVFNLFDNDKLVTWDTEISGNTGGPVDSFGLPTTFTEGPNFGNATDDADYSIPREIRVSLGLRF